MSAHHNAGDFTRAALIAANKKVERLEVDLVNARARRDHAAARSFDLQHDLEGAHAETDRLQSCALVLFLLIGGMTGTAVAGMVTTAAGAGWIAYAAIVVIATVATAVYVWGTR